MSRELLKECLDYLIEANNKTFGEYENLVDKLSTELAKPDFEPVAIVEKKSEEHNTVKLLVKKRYPVGTKFYTTPPDQSARIAGLEQRIKELKVDAFCDAKAKEKI